MIRDLPDDAVRLLGSARRAPLVAAERRSSGPHLDRHAIMVIIPHRSSFLLIERVTAVDRERAIIVAHYDPRAAETVIGAHFPADPMVPGVLQVEAVGQAGLCLIRLLADGAGASPNSTTPGSAEPVFRLTQIVDAHFLRPVRPGAAIEVAASVVADGLFNIVVGQCVQHDEVCSVAVVRGTSMEAQL